LVSISCPPRYYDPVRYVSARGTVCPGAVAVSSSLRLASRMRVC
jgi:hypothetical protein